MSCFQDYYGILQVSPHASPEAIRSAYKRLVEKWQTERRPGDAAAFEQLAALDAAHEVLLEPGKRQEYDALWKKSIATGEGGQEGVSFLAQKPIPTLHYEVRGAHEASPVPGLGVATSIESPEQALLTDEEERQKMAHTPESVARGKDPSQKPAVSLATWVIFTLGMLFFLLTQQMNAAAVLVRCVVWALIFGVPAYCFYREKHRAGVTTVATLFCLATGFDLAVKISRPPISQVRLASFQRERLNESSQAIDRVDVTEPDSRTKASNLILSGQAAYEKKEFDKAIRDFDKAIQMDPENALAFYYRGLAWLQTKDEKAPAWMADKIEHDKAIKDFNEAIRLDPNHAPS